MGITRAGAADGLAVLVSLPCTLQETDCTGTSPVESCWVKDAMHSQHCTAGPLAVDGTHSVSLIHSDIGVVGGGGVSSVQNIFVVRVNAFIHMA